VKGGGNFMRYWNDDERYTAAQWGGELEYEAEDSMKGGQCTEIHEVLVAKAKAVAKLVAAKCAKDNGKDWLVGAIDQSCLDGNTVANAWSALDSAKSDSSCGGMSDCTNALSHVKTKQCETPYNFGLYVRIQSADRQAECGTYAWNPSDGSYACRCLAAKCTGTFCDLDPSVDDPEKLAFWKEFLAEDLAGAMKLKWFKNESVRLATQLRAKILQLAGSQACTSEHLGCIATNSCT